MPPVASTTARGAIVTDCASASPTVAQSQPGDRAVLGQQRFGDVAFDHADRGRGATASISAAMIAVPAMSPRTWTMRRAECAASRPTASRPSRSRSKGTP